MAVDLPIDTQGTAWFAFSCELVGVTYGFTFRWNDREGAWFLDLTDGEGNPIGSGIKIVVSLDLLGPFHSDPRCPVGALVAFDTTGQDLDPGFADLGDRVLVMFMEPADFG